MSTVNNKPIFIYWDNSNIYIAAQKVAMEKEGKEARHRVRIQFDHLYKLASAGRKVHRAFAAGSVPPELNMLWNQLGNAGVEVELQERGERTGKEQGVDQALQLRMFKDGFKNKGNLGIVVLLTGDGDFHETLNLLYESGWSIEVLSWRHSCNKVMRKWVEKIGIFVALDDFYDQITFLESSRPEQSYSPARPAVPLDLSKRKTVTVNKQ